MRPTIGDQIARRRRQLPLTQEQLAEAAGVSVETIRKLEQNDRTSARMSTLSRIARALDVPTSALLGNAAQSAAQREPDHDQVALLELRRALTPARGLGGLVVGSADVRSPTPEQIAEAIRVVDRAYHADNYAATLAALPDLLVEARRMAEAATGAAQPAAYELVAQAYQVAGTALIQMRSFDLAYRALSAALDAADESGNDLVGASAVVTMCWLLLRQGRFGEAEQLAVATADAVEPRFSKVEPARLAAWGWLLLRAAAAAVRDNRDGDAEELLDGAAAAAVRIGERTPPVLLSPGPASIGAFCPTTVEMKRVEASVIAERPDRALQLAQRVPPSDRPTSNNRNRHRLDVAWAHANTGAYAAATGVLLDVRTNAPAWLRHQRYAGDIIGTIASAKRRALSQDLADLAALVGVDG
jgi:transcriptional regulator with XRE-family HTH domain